MFYICCSPLSSEEDSKTEDDGSQSSQDLYEPFTTESASKKRKTITESDLRKEHDLRKEKLSRECQRMRRWRKNMTDEKKKEYLSKARQRMQKIRQEKVKTLKTPSQIKKTREMWVVYTNMLLFLFVFCYFVLAVGEMSIRCYSGKLKKYL